MVLQNNGGLIIGFVLLSKLGEIIFFDRSWYNRVVAKPVNGFCSP